MNIQGLSHFTIRTTLVNETADFYAKVIGMEVGPRPAFLFPGVWMYAEGRPILHIVSFIEPNQHMDAYLGQKIFQNVLAVSTIYLFKVLIYQKCKIT